MFKQNRILIGLLLITVSFVGAACMHIDKLNQKHKPAIIVKASDESVVALEKGVSILLFDRQVTLSHKAFADSNILLVDNQQTINDGRLLDGRRQNAALAFTLWLHNKNCVLRRESNQQTLILQGVTCQAL